MNEFWLGLLAVSVTLLVAVLIRSKLSWSWVSRLGLQLVAAALVLYVLNYSGIVSGLQIPLNPITIATVIMLGVPGIFLILGLQWFVVG